MCSKMWTLTSYLPRQFCQHNAKPLKELEQAITKKLQRNLDPTPTPLTLPARRERRNHNEVIWSALLTSSHQIRGCHPTRLLTLVE